MKGATAIEILVVIAIVGILGAVTIDYFTFEKQCNAGHCEEACNIYQNRTLKDIPVKCLKYFQK